MSTVFEPTDHPRARNGRFIRKVNAPQTGQLTDAGKALVDRRVALSEMIGNAPAGTDRIVMELYSEGTDDQMMVFSHFADADGEEIDVDGDLVDEMRERAYEFDATTAVEHGFTRDGEMFVFQKNRPTLDDAAAEVDDAILAYQLTFNDPDRRVKADAHLHETVGTYLRVAAEHLDAKPVSVLLDWDTDGLTVTDLEDESGQSVGMNWEDWDRVLEMGFVASNITDARAAGLIPLRGVNGPFRLIIR